MVEGKMCRGMLVKPVHHKPYTAYIDPDTNLVTRFEWQSIDAESGRAVTDAEELLDYKPALESIQPFRQIDYSDGQKTTETIISSMLRDDSISDSCFDPPEKHKIAGLENGPVTIPFTMKKNYIIVQARLNDAQNCTFVLDTGCGLSVLRGLVSRQLGQVEGFTSTVAAGGSMKAGLVYAKRLQLGNISLNDIPFATANLTAVRRASNMMEVDGYLGSDVLSRFVVTIDYLNRKLILADPDQVEIPPYATVLETRRAQGGTFVLAKLDDTVEIPCLVDTGAMINDLPAALIKAIAPGSLLPVSTVMGFDGQLIKAASVKLRSLKLGNLVVPGPVFAVAADNSTSTGLVNSQTRGILGNSFWSRFTLTLDYQHNRLILEPYDDAVRNALDETAQIRLQYLKSHDYEKAADTLNKSMDKASAAEAVRAVYRTSLATLIAEQAGTTTDKDKIKLAQDQFELAIKEAVESGNKVAEARAKGRLAIFSAQVHPDSVSDLKELLRSASEACPDSADALVGLAWFLIKTDSAKAQSILNQVLSKEPDNWDALSLRRQLAHDENKPKDEELIVAQMLRYYPGVPEVTNLSGQVHAK